MQHSYQKENMANKLIQELEDSSIRPKLLGIDINGFNIVIETEDLDSGEQTILDDLISDHDHTTINMNKYVQKKILAAMEFGKNLMSEYGARNVLSGKTVAQVKDISDKLGEIQVLLLSGSLYVALNEIANITPDSLVTQSDLDEFTTKIQAYLVGA